MAFNKDEVMQWSTEEKRSLAFELLDSIDEETIRKPLPEWKEILIKERIKKDEQAEDVVTWNVLREKYRR